MTDKNYTCHVCNGVEFTHDVNIVYGEVFNSKNKTVIIGKNYTEGDDWYCVACNTKIPDNKTSNFLEQMFNASIE
jgi:hypothetical protein